MANITRNYNMKGMYCRRNLYSNSFVFCISDSCQCWSHLKGKESLHSTYRGTIQIPVYKLL